MVSRPGRLGPAIRWRAPSRARSRPRLHSGFGALRTHMPMNIRASHPGKGLNAEVQRNIDRIQSLWVESRRRFGHAGPFLFGHFCAADAMFAPVVMRFRTTRCARARYRPAYCEAMQAAPGVRAWMEESAQESEFVADDEPYSAAPA